TEAVLAGAGGALGGWLRGRLGGRLGGLAARRLGAGAGDRDKQEREHQAPHGWFLHPDRLRLGMTTTSFDFFDSPAGRFGLAWSPDGLAAVALPGAGTRAP